MTITQDDLANRFTYHPPRGNQAQRYEDLRAYAYGFAEIIVELTPGSREQSLALTKLEEVVMWANASIARNEVDVPDPSRERDPDHAEAIAPAAAADDDAAPAHTGGPDASKPGVDEPTQP